MVRGNKRTSKVDDAEPMLSDAAPVAVTDTGTSMYTSPYDNPEAEPEYVEKTIRHIKKRPRATRKCLRYCCIIFVILLCLIAAGAFAYVRDKNNKHGAVSSSTESTSTDTGDAAGSTDSGDFVDGSSSDDSNNDPDANDGDDDGLSVSTPTPTMFATAATERLILAASETGAARDAIRVYGSIQGAFCIPETNIAGELKFYSESVTNDESENDGANLIEASFNFARWSDGSRSGVVLDSQAVDSDSTGSVYIEADVVPGATYKVRMAMKAIIDKDYKPDETYNAAKILTWLEGNKDEDSDALGRWSITQHDLIKAEYNATTLTYEDTIVVPADSKTTLLQIFYSVIYPVCFLVSRFHYEL